MRKPRIFLSHTTRDRRDDALAHGLARGLDARGADVWIAPDSIPPGERWAEKIVSGIMEECSAFLVIVSAASRDAAWVGKEIELATERARRDPTFKILPLSVGTVADPHGQLLESLQHIPYHEALHDQLEAVFAAIGLPPRSGITLPPSAVTAEEFVGREYVFDAIGTFVANHPCGYLVIEADPGAGKSALLAEFARRENAIAHYNIRSLGINKVTDFVTNVHAQLVERFALRGQVVPDGATESGAFLSKLLAESAGQLREGEKLVLVVDALDEVDTTDHPEGANILFLPPKLPDRVFVVMSRRNVDLKLVTTSPYEVCKLSAFADETRRDVRAYVGRALRNAQLRRWIDSRGLDEDEFVTTMADKSEGNFMYLRYVLPALAGGAYEQLAIDHLPQGLQEYYQDHWRRMGMTTKPLPRDKIRIVYVLAEARRAVSRKLISHFASTPDVAIDELAVQEVLDGWREFLHEVGEQPVQYGVYHASFRDFLHRKDVVQAAGVTLPEIHGFIADDLWGRLFHDDREQISN